MSLMRLNQIEAIIADIEEQDQVSLHDQQRINVLEAEANSICDVINIKERKDKEERARREQEELDKAEQQRLEAIERFNKIADDVSELKKLKKWDEMFTNYGSEFAGDYEGHEDGTVVSFVSFDEDGSPQVWETEDSDKKIKYLVNHRIYNKYVR